MQPRGEDPWINEQNPEEGPEPAGWNSRGEGEPVGYPATLHGAEKDKEMRGLARGSSRQEGPANRDDLFSNVEMLR